MFEIGLTSFEIELTSESQ